MASKRKKPKSTDIKVFISNRESRCDECTEDLGRMAWIFLAGDRGALCLSCADLDHLVFLPSGSAALTRRSKKLSCLYAVVLRFSSARKRYERQGLLVEEEALLKAEAACLADADAREAARLRRAERAAALDREYIERFAERVRELFPACPAGREQVIAEHACLKYSGRVGRSAEAKELDQSAVELAVQAHVRHAETDYDRLLVGGVEWEEARGRVRAKVNSVLDRWSERSHADGRAPSS